MPSIPVFIRTKELQKARVSLRADAIVQTDIFAEQELLLADVKEVIQAIREVSDDVLLPQLIVAGPLSGPDSESMKFLASEGSSPTAIAEAYVIESLSQRIIGNFYLKFNKPARPTRMFYNTEEAVFWLEEQRAIFEASKLNKKN